MNRFINGACRGGRVLSVVALCGTASAIAPLYAADPHMMAPRVPADQIQQARALTSPLPESPEVIEKGKALYEGKGICVTCHGTTGRGDGLGAAGSIRPRATFTITASGVIAPRVKFFG